MRISRPLITFAFVAHSFERHGDIGMGLEPLFAPLIQRRTGEIFNPDLFAADVSDTYGLRMHPYVAHDMAAKLEQQGLLSVVSKGDGFIQYRNITKNIDYPDFDEHQINDILVKFFSYCEERIRKFRIEITQERLESAFGKRLITMEFLHIVHRPQPSYLKSSTLTLAKKETEDALEKLDETLDEDTRIDSILDYLCASFFYDLNQHDPEAFRLLSDVSCGALLAEVVLGLRTPPSSGQTAEGLMIFLDAPFIMELLSLGTEDQNENAKELCKFILKTKANVCCFAHNIKEIEDNIDGPVRNLAHHMEVYGPTGRLLLQDSAARTYVRSIRKDVAIAVERVGIEIIDMNDKTWTQNNKFYTPAMEEHLARNIGMYLNPVARERDAKSVSDIIRIRGDTASAASLFGSKAVFVTENPRLSNLANEHLKHELRYVEGSFPPIITDRYLAGVLWIAQGGEGLDVPRRKLLANCTAAMIPRRDVITKMYEFLAALDQTKARHFEALVLNDRCAHYLMDQALGDAQLVTEENFAEIYDEIRRSTAQEVLEEKAQEIGRIKSEYDEMIVGLKGKLAESATEAASRSDEADRLGRTLEERENKIIERCVDAGVRAGKFENLKITAALGLLGALVSFLWHLLGTVAPIQSFSDIYLVAGPFVLTAAYCALQFRISPDFFRKEHLMRVRNKALEQKAKEFDAEQLLASYEIDWPSRSVTKKGKTAQSAK